MEGGLHNADLERKLLNRTELSESYKESAFDRHMHDNPLPSHTILALNYFNESVELEGILQGIQ